MSVTGTPEIHLRLLGGFDVSIRGENRTRGFSYAKVKLLLAILALAQGRGLARAELSEMLWPDTIDGRNNLRHALSVLRNLLRDVPHALSIEGNLIQLASHALTVDVLAFLDLDASAHRSEAERLSWYRGPLLESLRMPGVGALETWRQGWRVRIDQQLARSRTRLLDDLRARGRIDEALREVRTWVGMWPEDESVHRHLIHLYIADKQYEAATRAFEYCSLVLRERLGVDPDAETAALLTGMPRHLSANHTASRMDVGPGRRPIAILGLVLSCDGDDPEDVGELLARTSSQIREFALGAGAWAAVNFDHTMLVCFGYPLPEERPARRAIAAAYRLQRLSLPRDVGLAIGAHVGLTVSRADGAPDAGAVVSPRAMQLAWIAKPGEILMTARMAARVSSDFLVTSERRHGQQLVSLGAPLPPRAPGRVFGRLPEFERLTRLWAELPGYCKPKGLLLRGEPGIGKSFLSGLLAEHVLQTGGYVTRLRCDGPHAAQVPWGPVRAWLLETLHGAGLYLSGGDARASSETAASEWLQSHIGLAADLANAVSALLHPSHGLTVTSMASPNEGRRHRLLDTLPAVVLHRAKPYQPMLLVIEDVHWADGPTLDLIGALLNRDEIGPVLLLITARDEFIAPWPIEEMGLQALDAGSIADLIAYRSRGRNLARSIREDIARRSGGIPLYAEELVNQALLGDGQRLPESVADLVSARVAQLDPTARRLAHLIAVTDEGIHPVFLARCLDIPATELTVLLEQLTRRGLPPDASGHGFRHALIADAVYQTMSRADRQATHRLVAEALMADGRQIDPSRIAHHLEAAADPRCAGWWVAAACSALAGAVPLKEAAGLAERALPALSFIADHGQYREAEIQCRLVLGMTYAELLGSSAAQTRESYERVAELCDDSDTATLFLALWGRWLVYHASMPHADAVALASRLAQIAEGVGHHDFRGWALYALGLGYIYLGDVAKAERNLRDAVRLLPSARPHNITEQRYQGPTAVNTIRGVLGWSMVLQGRLDEGLAQAREGVERALHVNEAFDQLTSVMVLATLQRMRADLPGFERSSRQLIELAAVHSMPFWGSLGEANLGWLAAMRGDDSGLPAMRAAIEGCGQAHPTLQTEHFVHLAESLLALNRPQDALDELTRASANAERYGSVVERGRIELVRGDVMARLGDALAARAHWSTVLQQGQRTGLSWLSSRAAQRLRDADPARSQQQEGGLSA